MRSFGLAAALAVAIGCATGGAHGPPPSVDLGTFHQALDPYGEWVTLDPWGECWRPLGAGPDWLPFTIGYWVWADENWLWVAADPWGSLPYHYGRWTLDGVYGWLWVPGFDWSPAWVVWRAGPEYVGWAPVGPRVALRTVASWPAAERWVFVPARKFSGGPVARDAVPRSVASGLARRVEPAPAPAPRVASRPPPPEWGGPPRAAIERVRGGVKVPVRRLVQAPSPRSSGRDLGDLVEVYRPNGRHGPPSDAEEAAMGSERRSAPAPAPSTTAAGAVRPPPAPAPGAASAPRPKPAPPAPASASGQAPPRPAPPGEPRPADGRAEIPEAR